jgi:hypothetical protein
VLEKWWETVAERCSPELGSRWRRSRKLRRDEGPPGGGGRAWTRGRGQRRGKGGGAHAADEEENGRKRGMMAMG